MRHASACTVIELGGLWISGLGAAHTNDEESAVGASNRALSARGMSQRLDVERGSLNERPPLHRSTRAT